MSLFLKIMTEAEISVACGQFSCSICLDLMKNPAALLCGHSFCMDCINNCWDQEDQKGVYSCPQCKETFTPRPVVSKNTVLAEVVETLKKMRLQATSPAQCSAGPEDVECDSCTERKHKAIKSCLVCLASFCETHLQPHYKSAAFKKHKLVEASRRLQEQICSQHDKLLEVYCRTDQQCICMLCTMDQHKGHDTVSAAAGRVEKQKQLFEIQGKSKQRIQKREKELQHLRKAVESHKHSAQTAVQETGRIFTELIKSIEKRWSEATKLIRAQEKTAVTRAEEVMKKLEQEIADQKKRDDEMEVLSHTEDPIQYLQTFKSLSSSVGPSNLPTIMLSPLQTFENVIKSVSQLKEKVEEHSKTEFEKISKGVSEVQIIPPPPLTLQSPAVPVFTFKPVKKESFQFGSAKIKPKPVPTTTVLSNFSFTHATPTPQKKEDFQINATTQKVSDSDAQKKAFQLFSPELYSSDPLKKVFQSNLPDQKPSIPEPQKKDFQLFSPELSSCDPLKKVIQSNLPDQKPSVPEPQKKGFQFAATPLKPSSSDLHFQFAVASSSDPLNKIFCDLANARNLHITK